MLTTYTLAEGLHWLDLIGVLAFAMSGALLGVRKRFDLFGVLVLGAVTAVGGGAIRDSLTGQTPPLFLRDETYLWT
ncbi:TRIC cation channel family protein, partial [Klebsiella pneumoniae]|uniref:trimeric intracellular cation channel family protein n=1 Tax=Klebsiella pneumoniae TaxID=573 RepID=UPI001D0E2070